MRAGRAQALAEPSRTQATGSRVRKPLQRSFRTSPDRDRRTRRTAVLTRSLPSLPARVLDQCPPLPPEDTGACPPVRRNVCEQAENAGSEAIARATSRSSGPNAHVTWLGRLGGLS